MPKNILRDAEVKLIGYTSEKKYPESFRVIRLYDPGLEARMNP